jgi:hypothetical protein
MNTWEQPLHVFSRGDKPPAGLQQQQRQQQRLHSAKIDEVIIHHHVRAVLSKAMLMSVLQAQSACALCRGPHTAA